MDDSVEIVAREGGEDESKESGKSANHANTIRATRHPRPVTVPKVSYPTRSLEFLQSISDSSSELVPHQAKVRLRIAIVGGGLGGLASAIALARRGHSVTVLEQAHELGEVGAGIQIPSNSNLLLERWGVNKFLAGKTVAPAGMTFRRWQNGKAIAYTKLVPDFRENFGASYSVVHRADFHDALHKRALQLGVEVKVDSKVVKYDTTTPSVELANGILIPADLIVAADGVKSAARRVILGEDQAPKPAGFAAYRATVDVEKIKSDPEISWLVEKPSLNLWIGPGRHVMTYSIASGKSFNMVLNKVDDTDPSTWNHEGALEDMRREYSGWDPQLTKIIGMIDKTMKWPIITGTPLPTWIARFSKVIILGDAAHAMIPYMSQGAAMAVEDGAALATVLNLIDKRSLIPLALTVFEKERLKRTSQMQEASLINGILFHFPDGAEQEARDEAMRAEVEGRHYSFSANQWSDPVTQWWAYGYDAEAAMQSAWDAAVS